MGQAFTSTNPDNLQPKELCANRFKKRLFKKPVQLEHDLYIAEEGWGYKKLACKCCDKTVTVFQLP